MGGDEASLHLHVGALFDMHHEPIHLRVLKDGVQDLHTTSSHRMLTPDC